MSVNIQLASHVHVKPAALVAVHVCVRETRLRETSGSKIILD